MTELRELPKVDDLARSRELADFPAKVRIEAVRKAVDSARLAIRKGLSTDVATILTAAVNEALSLTRAANRNVINMSGVILHTGLGRARLATEAMKEIARVASGHSYLELDEEQGTRGDRQEQVRRQLIQLTGAEDALVVNNAAAALVLALRTLAEGRDVLLSRGQMVEIGGSFRVPEIVKQSGCNLVEVGCTNKTHLHDYQVTDQTGTILVCHRSNFEIVGFASEPSLEELAGLGVPVVDDMGTGCLLDLSQFGLPKLKTFSDSLGQGAAIAVGSGDKLLGGPQAGIILGHKELVGKMKRHPLARALRVDKLTIAGLAATLRLYLEDRVLEIPTIRYLARPEVEVRKMANRFAKAIGPQAFVEAGQTEIGGGSGPGTLLGTFRVGIRTGDAVALARKLRISEPGLLGRIERDIYWLDPRTAEGSEIGVAARLVRSCLV